MICHVEPVEAVDGRFGQRLHLAPVKLMGGNGYFFVKQRLGLGNLLFSKIVRKQFLDVV